MSGLPPINHPSEKMLPAVYRRADVARPATIMEKRSLQGAPGEQLVDISNNGYRPLRKNSAALVEPGSAYPKGMVIDVWI